MIDSRRVKMVDLVGIEPTTSSMPWKRAPSCATGPLEGTLLSDADDLDYFRRLRGDSQRGEGAGNVFQQRP